MTYPEQLGKYRIGGILGEGAMGVVYHGTDNIGRKVAIKTIRPGLLKGRTGRELVSRFRREAEAEARLNHPNIVGIYEFQEEADGMPFFAMEFVEGKPLKDYLSRGMHFSLDMSLHIMIQLLSALAHSHSRGIIHRDIKPANILLVDDDSVKIADFGIAHMEESDFTQTGQIIGTPQYFSPEQRLGAKIDARSDLYSTALVFFEMLTGTKLFTLYPELASTQQLNDEHLEKLGMYPPETQKTLKTILIKALCREPGKRYQSGKDFSDALKPLMVEEDQSVPRGSKWLIWTAAALGLILLGATYYASQRELQWPDIIDDVIGTSTNDPNIALPVETQEKLDRLLRVGKIHQTVGRLILPEGSNAYHAYNMALQLSPGNPLAMEGLGQVQEQLSVKLEKMVAAGEINSARIQLGKARSLFPDDRRLRQLEEEVGSNAMSNPKQAKP